MERYSSAPAVHYEWVRGRVSNHLPSPWSWLACNSGWPGLNNLPTAEILLTRRCHQCTEYLLLKFTINAHSKCCSTSGHWDLEIWAQSVSADARWPVLAGYSSASAVPACCDSPSLSTALSSKVSRWLLCTSLWSCWSPAPAICQMSSTVSSTSSPQHLWDPCIFCRQIKSLEFTAWSSAGSSCWPRTI